MIACVTIDLVVGNLGVEHDELDARSAGRLSRVLCHYAVSKTKEANQKLK
jgi:hypothetical protein